MSALKTLGEIADQHGCDKGLTGPGPRWSANNYVDVYEALFRESRSSHLNLLEIGIGVSGEFGQARVAHGRNLGGGASLKTWADYFPHARIFGLDINRATHLDTDRIRTFQVDQGDRVQLREFLEKVPDIEFDIVIDDGSHRADHQQISLEEIWPRLRKAGTYFIEDLNDRSVGPQGQGDAGLRGAVPTRRFFRTLHRTGEILEPNAFSSTAFLDEVDDIVFYCPRVFLRPRDVFLELVRLSLGRYRKGLLRSEYRRDSHRLLALRKRDLEP